MNKNLARVLMQDLKYWRHITATLEKRKSLLLEIKKQVESDEILDKQVGISIKEVEEAMSSNKKYEASTIQRLEQANKA